MYYKGVNRGLFLTTPGWYTIFLVLALGFIAIASSYNGIYLAVSLGLSILIVSGILSEKVMAYYELAEIQSTTAEPNTPFSVRLRASNENAKLHLYGVENQIFLASGAMPKITDKMIPLMRSVSVTIPPKQTVQISASCQGFKRGIYRDFFAVQRTLYPFGLLAKFKVSQLHTLIRVLPKFDSEFGDLLRQQMKPRLQGMGTDLQFHSHRSFTSRDSLKAVDWKKSAGRDSEHWILKTYESFIEDFGILIEINPGYLKHQPNEESYEKHLSYLRTTCDVVREMGRRFALCVGTERFWFGYESVLTVLSEYPNFQQKEKEIPTPSTSLLNGNYLKLDITRGNIRWAKQPVVIYL